MITESEEDERQEKEDRTERDLRWAPPGPTDLIPAVVPRTIRLRRVIRERTEILEIYSEAEFRQLFRFYKDHFLRIVDLLMDDFPSGRGAISPDKRVGLFLSYLSENEPQVKLGF